MCDTNMIKLLTFLLLLACTTFGLASASRAAEPTQRDWMIELVNTLDLSFGLPDDPEDGDYMQILRGYRTFRFEAEDTYAPEEDEVSKMAFGNFGSFSGSAWLNGLSRSTTVHLRFTLPLSGRYHFSAALRNGPHEFSLGDQRLTASGEQRFSHVEIADVALEAGSQEIVVTLPPGGAIDYIELTAPARFPISPRHGWQPDQPLAWDDIQITLLQAFELGDLLAAADSPQRYEAEDLDLHKEQTFSLTSIEHLGRPSGGSWLRAGNLSGQLRFGFELETGNFYRPALRILGKEVVVDFNNEQRMFIDGLSYLENFSMAPIFLYQGANQISIDLPPGGGFDYFELTDLNSSLAAGSELLGLKPVSPAPSTSDLEHLAALLAAFGTNR